MTEFWRTALNPFTRPWWTALATAGLVLFLVTSSGLADSSESSGCASLETDPQDRFRYMKRKGRCEGTYIRKNSGGGSQLLLLGLTERAPLGSSGAPDMLQITWPADVPNGVTLQQLSIRAAADPGGKHYQMDVYQPFSVGFFDWSLEVLKGVGISEAEVHLQASARTKVGSKSSQLLYAPLRKGPRQGSATAYDFTLRPSDEVNSLTYTIRSLEAGSWSGPSAPKEASFGAGVAKRSFVVSIPRLEFGQAAGVHRVDFSARLGDSQSPVPDNCSVVFFND